MNDRVQTIRNAEKARNGEIVHKNTITVLGTNLSRPLDEEECQYLTDLFHKPGYGLTRQFGYELPEEHYSLLLLGLVDEQWQSNSTVMVLLTPEGIELTTNMVADEAL